MSNFSKNELEWSSCSFTIEWICRSFASALVLAMAAFIRNFNFSSLKESLPLQAAVTAWLKHQVDIDGTRGDSSTSLALRVTFRVIVLACSINAVVHCAIDHVGLLPYPLSQALLFGFFTTASITFVVSFVIMLVIGRAIRELAVQRDTFERLSCMDALSGLRNRRAFFEYIAAVPDVGLLILVDVDRFKTINDTYGHLAGDEVIRGLGQTLRSVFLGIPAVIGRIGGEEFAVFLPKVAGSPRDPAETLRAAVAEMVVAGIQGPITVSIGVAITKPQRSAMEVYAAADRALYVAKSGGRNRVVHENEVGLTPQSLETATAEARSLSDAEIEVV